MGVLDRIADLEAKVVRHVRTPEGVEKYGLPIGSPIVARANKIRTRVVRNKPIERPLNMGASDDDQLADKRDKNGVYWREPVQSEAGRGIDLVGNLRDGRRFLIARAMDDYGRMKSYSVIVNDKNGNTISIHHDFADIAKARRWVGTHLEDEARRKPKRKKKDYDSFYEFHQGVYGYDWTWGDEDPELLAQSASDDPVISRRARRMLAVAESERLAISVVAPEGSTKVDTAAWEIINSIVNVYEEMYPGSSSYFPVFKLDPNYFGFAMGAMAYNQTQKRVNAAKKWDTINDRPGTERELVTDLTPSADGQVRDWDHSEIGMSDQYFGEGFDENRLAREAKTEYEKGWFSTNPPKLAEKHDLEVWQAYQHHLLNHEIGHTLGRVLLGEFSTQNHDSSDYTKTSIQELYDILYKYGAVKDVPPNQLERYSRDKDDTTTLNRDVLKAHISGYGGASVHEMLAEAWAAYMMEESPTEMQVEIAQLMEWYWNDWLEKDRSSRDA